MAKTSAGIPLDVLIDIDFFAGSAEEKECMTQAAIRGELVLPDWFISKERKICLERMRKQHKACLERMRKRKAKGVTIQVKAG